MLFIRKTLCDAHCISHKTLIPGRLALVRVHLDGHNLDVVAVYQHNFSPDFDKKQLRNQLWHALDTCLESLPRRNTLAIFGDFNTSLTRAPDYIGILDFLDTPGHRRIGPVPSNATEFY